MERETYLSNKLATETNPAAKTGIRDNLSCVYEQDSYEEEDMTQVTAFLAPTYRLAGLAVGFIPRKLSTISSHSMSVNKELDTEVSPEDSSPDDRLCIPVDETKGDIENSITALPDTRLVGAARFPPPTAADRPRPRYPRSRRYPSDSNIRRRCDSPTQRSLHRDFIRRVATMPIIVAHPESQRRFDPHPATDDDGDDEREDDDDDVFINSVAPEKLLETHFPLDEPPDEGDPLL